MNNRNNILNTIKSEIKKYITVVNGYSFTPIVVERGVYAYNDLENMLPALCLTFTQEVPYEDDTYVKTYDDIDIKAMSVIFYGYAKSDDAVSSDKIYAMVNDVETFLKSTDFSYHDTTNINIIEVKEAGPKDKVLSFIIETQIIVNDDVVQ